MAKRVELTTPATNTALDVLELPWGVRRRTAAMTSFLAMTEQEPELRAFTALFEDAHNTAKKADAKKLATLCALRISDLVPDLGNLPPKARLRSAEVMILLRAHLLTLWAEIGDHQRDWVG